MTVLKTRLYTVVKQLVGSETVVYTNQNAPRPPLPFWTIDIRSLRRVGTEYFGQGVDVEGDEQVIATREATVSIQRLGKDSEEALADFRDKLFLTTTRDLWSSLSIACYDVGDVRSVPYVLDDSKWEERAALDVFIRFSVELTDRVGIIEYVNLTHAEE